MQISIVILLFSDQISGRGKSFQGGQTASGGRQTASGGAPCPLWEKARLEFCAYGFVEKIKCF